MRRQRGELSIAALTTSRWSLHDDETQNRDRERSQPVSGPAGYGRDVDRGDRDEPIELARRWHCSGVERQPLKKIAIDQDALLKLLSRWREEAEKKGYKITR